MSWPEAVVACVGFIFGAPSAAVAVLGFMSAAEGRDPWPWRNTRQRKGES